MKAIKVVFLVLLSILSLCAVNSRPVSANPRTIVVPDDYSKIGWAIGNATEGDTIFVKKGIYYEHLQINTSLSLIGENRDTTIIEGDLGGDILGGYNSPVTVAHDNVTIAGFTVRNALSTTAVGILLYPQVRYCNISGNRVTRNTYGIVLIVASDNNIIGNIADSNTAVGIMLSGAPSSQGSSRNNIQGNQILSNGAEGIVLRMSDSNNITGNNIANSTREGILLSWANNNAISENNLTNSGVGIGDAGDGNTFYRNNFANNTQQVYASWLSEVDGKVVFSVGSWNENYWSDYNGKDNNGDGIGDTPYIIDEKSQDNNPLMAPYSPSSTIQEFPDEENLPIPTSEPFPINWIVAATAIIATGGIAITLGVAFYRRKRLTSSKTP